MNIRRICVSLGCLALLLSTINNWRKDRFEQTHPTQRALSEPETSAHLEQQAHSASINTLKNTHTHNHTEHTEHTTTTTTTIPTESNTESWPSASILSLKTTYPKYHNAIDHIVRATHFEDFASLSARSEKRLIQYTQSVLSLPVEQITHLCWGHNTSEAQRATFEGVRALAIAEVRNYTTPQPIFQADARWSYTATDGATGNSGTPITLTWSFVPDGTSVPDGGASPNNQPTTGASDLIAKLNAAYGTPTVANDLTTAPWFSLFENAFALWAEITGNIYIYEPNDDAAPLLNFENGSIGTRGDVRIGGINIDGNGGTLAFNYFPNIGDMVIDSADSTNLGSGQEMAFTNVLAHEHGHGLGLNHVCPINQTKLMEPYLSTAFVGPQFDDILTVQEVYGDALERQASNKNNNTPMTAHSLGTLDTAFNTDLLSIANASDKDMFRFQLSQRKMLNVSATPTNTVPYLEGAQSPTDDSCSSGNLFAPGNRQDLILRVLDADGSSVIASSNISPIGNAETIFNIPLEQTAQGYYIEVTGDGQNSSSDNNTQAYSLDITLDEISSIQLKDFAITQEACAPANGTADPNELISVQITVENSDANIAEDVAITLSGSSNLTILGNAVQELPDLPANSSTTITYQLSLSGTCGATETLTFQADFGSLLTTITQNITLGANETIYSENFDSVAIGAIPSGYTESSPRTAAKWRTVNASSPSGSNAIFAPGKSNSNTVNSAYLESVSISSITAQSRVLFDHSYDTEDNYDGGVLEISMDNGNTWQEWTDAGGSFAQNGYNQIIASDQGNPLQGQAAWTGDSDGLITTIAQFPTSAQGKAVRLRWHMGNDEWLKSSGWYLDNIRITTTTCCETIIPILDVTAIDPTTSENDPTDSAEFVITSDITPSSNLTAAYTLSGAAISGSDYIALAGSVMINSGQSTASIQVNAISDLEIEGDEQLVLTLSPSVYYGINTGSASITIIDQPFDAYRFENFGTATTGIGSDEDFDDDGILNLIEYAFGLDPTSSDTLPFSLIVQGTSSSQLELTYYENSELDDIEYIVETSTTLAAESWTTTGVTIITSSSIEGIDTKVASVDIDSQARFIRVRINRISPIGTSAQIKQAKTQQYRILSFKLRPSGLLGWL